jgi:hypothetical protein
MASATPLRLRFRLRPRRDHNRDFRQSWRSTNRLRIHLPYTVILRQRSPRQSQGLPTKDLCTPSPADCGGHGFSHAPTTLMSIQAPSGARRHSHYRWSSRVSRRPAATRALVPFSFDPCTARIALGLQASFGCILIRGGGSHAPEMEEHEVE